VDKKKPMHNKNKAQRPQTASFESLPSEEQGVDPLSLSRVAFGNKDKKKVMDDSVLEFKQFISPKIKDQMLKKQKR
jgi:hypothetical protein